MPVILTFTTRMHPPVLLSLDFFKLFMLDPKSKRKSGLVETRPAALAVCIFIKPGAYEQPWPQGMSDYCNYPVSITPNVPYMIHDNEF